MPTAFRSFYFFWGVGRGGQVPTGFHWLNCLLFSSLVFLGGSFVQKFAW